jgi:hypothetical protein
MAYAKVSIKTIPRVYTVSRPIDVGGCTALDGAANLMRILPETNIEATKLMSPLSRFLIAKSKSIDETEHDFFEPLKRKVTSKGDHLLF